MSNEENNKAMENNYCYTIEQLNTKLSPMYWTSLKVFVKLKEAEKEVINFMKKNDYNYREALIVNEIEDRGQVSNYITTKEHGTINIVITRRNLIL